MQKIDDLLREFAKAAPGLVGTRNDLDHGHEPVTADLADRQVTVPWEAYAVLPTVILIAHDPAVTSVDLTARTPIQVVRGSPMTDSSGTRRATPLTKIVRCAWMWKRTCSPA